MDEVHTLFFSALCYGVHPWKPVHLTPSCGSLSGDGPPGWAQGLLSPFFSFFSVVQQMPNGGGGGGKGRPTSPGKKKKKKSSSQKMSIYSFCFILLKLYSTSAEGL